MKATRRDLFRAVAAGALVGAMYVYTAKRVAVEFLARPAAGWLHSIIAVADSRGGWHVTEIYEDGRVVVVEESVPLVEVYNIHDAAVLSGRVSGRQLSTGEVV